MPEQEYTRVDKKTHDDKPMLLMAQRVEVALQDDVWFLDSGASNHMTGFRWLFSSLNETNLGTVKVVDNSIVEIRGKGSIILRGIEQ